MQIQFRIPEFLPLLLLALPCAAQKKAQAPPQTWPTSRVLAASCDAVWPVALQVLIGEGWGIRTSDRVGGVLTLDWTRGEWRGTKSEINPVIAKHTIEKTTGLYTIWNGFRIMPMTAIMAQAANGCSCSLVTVYHAQGGGFGAGEAWHVVRTSGWLEDKLLTLIESKLPKP